MSLILTLNETITARLRECMEAVGDEFRLSVRPIYGTPNGLRPILIGSCLLLTFEGEKYVVTAAHVLDWIPSHALYVSGVVGTEPVQIIGKIRATEEPPEGRDKDKLDIGIWRISSSEEQRLGAVKFIDASEVSHNRATTTNRVYMAMGYPLSKNRGKINHTAHTITTVMWKFSAGVVESSALAAALRVSGDDHFFLQYQKYLRNFQGRKVSQVNPKGNERWPIDRLGQLLVYRQFRRRSEAHRKTCWHGD